MRIESVQLKIEKYMYKERYTDCPLCNTYGTINHVMEFAEEHLTLKLLTINFYYLSILYIKYILYTFF